MQDQDSVFYCYKNLIQLRKKLAVLTDGNYQDLLPEHPSIWCYLRSNDSQKLWVMANLSDKPQKIKRPSNCSGEWKMLLNNYPQPLQLADEVELAPYQGVYLLQE